MATDAQHNRDNRAALRKAKQASRALDSILERVERKLISLRARKTIVRPDELSGLIVLWDVGVRNRFQDCEHALADFISVVNY